VDDHGHGQLQYAGTPVPKKMNALGNPFGPRVRGFFFPVREKAEIQAELEALAEAEAEADHTGQHELTD
jgi:ubiquinol-cytochrome c reductase cytochrome b subunit